MKTKNKLLATLLVATTANLLYAQSSSEKLVEKVTQSITNTNNTEQTFKENILKKVDEKISQSNSSPGLPAQAIVSKEVEKSYEEKRKEYPVMIGGYKITKKGNKYPSYSSATVVDSENNVYSLTNTNNKVVKSIRKDYIDYKEKDGTFRSTMVHHHLDNEKKISLKASSVNVLGPTPVRRTEAEPKAKLPTLEEVVSDFKK